MKHQTHDNLESDLFADGSLPVRDEQLSSQPLAARMRPQKLDEVIGQAHLLGEGKLLRRAIQANSLKSIIFYGPPGCGKTTLALLIAKHTRAEFLNLNAATANLGVLRPILEKAKTNQLRGIRTILFVDEIHRFSTSQQDVLMPFVEKGIVIFMGATTHNPFFSVNSPLISRSIVCELQPLDHESLRILLNRVLHDTQYGLGRLPIKIESDAIEHLLKSSNGDARRLLNALEMGALSTPAGSDGHIHFDLKVAEESCQKKAVYYDRQDDYHYDTISAFIKSMRASDVDQTLYWLAKMIYAGEDPRFILRRMIIFASEDIGNADPQALVLAAAAFQSFEFVGMPEGRIILGHAASYLSLAPKSRAAYDGISSALDDVEKKSIIEIPVHLRDTHYPGSKQLGRGSGDNAPDQVPSFPRYYKPLGLGFEITLRERLKELRNDSCH